MSQPSPLLPARQRAQALASSGDLAGARAILERAVELGRENLSEDDPDVLVTAYELGTVLQRADDPSAARRVLEEAYAAGQWRLGDSDPLMVQISHDIGAVAEELGNRHEARKAFGRVAEFGPAALGVGHWAVARARAYLGQDPVRAEAPHPAQQVTPPPPPQRSATPEQPQVQTGYPHQPRPQLGSQQPQPQTGYAQQSPPQAGFPQGPGPQVGVPQQLHGQDGFAQQLQAGSTQPDIPQQRPGGVDEPTVLLPLVTGQPPADRPAAAESAVASRARVQPPSPDNQQVWRPPAAEQPGAGSLRPIEEPTVAQPIITPRSGPPVDTYGAGAQIPGQRGASSLPGVGAGPAGRVGADGYPYPGGEHGSGGPPPPLGSAPGEASASYGKKGLGIFAAVAAVLASLIAVAALVFVLANRSGETPRDDNVPTLAGAAPGDVRLRDAGNGITVTWTDPAQGTVSFLVTMGRPGQELKPVGTLPPGQTSFEMGGLNPSLNYCFTVVAVYRSDQFAASPQACTSRPSTTPR